VVAATGLPAGVYTLTATAADGNGNAGVCSASVDVEITQPIQVAVSGTPTHVTCFGESNGSIAVSNSVGSTVVITNAADEVVAATGLPAGVYTLTATAADGNGNAGVCSASVDVEITQPAAIPLSGTVKYYKDYYLSGVLVPSLAMTKVTVTLYESGTNNYVADFETNGSGYYEFGNVCPGAYDVVLTTGKPAGSINATDAAQLNYWWVNRTTPTTGFTPIEKVRYFAGDVNDDGDVNSNDAGSIQEFYLTLGSSPQTMIDKPWEFWFAGDPVNTQPYLNSPMTVTINATDVAVVKNFFAMVSGDFNRSYVPNDNIKSASGSESLTLLKGKDVEVSPFTTIDLPITAVTDMQVGAISLALNYSDSKFEIEGVYLQDKPDQPVMYNDKDGQLRIAWNSLNPISLSAGETMLTVRLKATTNMSDGEVGNFKLAIDPLNELADETYEVIQNAVLKIDGLKLENSVTTGIDIPQGISEMLMSCYPNPFNEMATIKYTLPEDGRVNIEVTSMLGSRVRLLSDQQQTAGEYIMDLDGNNIVSGVYQVTLRFRNQNGKGLIRTVRMIKH
jgi:hypothetical protein